MAKKTLSPDAPLPKAGPRMEAICSLVPQCHMAAEIGTDHGIIAAHLLARGICERIIAADISAASLAKAKWLFALHGLDERAEFAVANGLDALEAPVDAAVIAGMSAATIKAILSQQSPHIASAALILQPNMDVSGLRLWLAQNGYAIQAERLIWDHGRYYVALRARPGSNTFGDSALWLGPCLMAEKPEHWQPYLLWRKSCLLRIQDDTAQTHIQWIQEALDAL